jgi:hypothetical protein
MRAAAHATRHAPPRAAAARWSNDALAAAPMRHPSPAPLMPRRRAVAAPRASAAIQRRLIDIAAAFITHFTPHAAIDAASHACSKEVCRGVAVCSTSHHHTSPNTR